MNHGFILLHRQLLDWEWYDHIPTKVLFIHCLLRANHSAGRWRGQSYKRGEFITSLNSLVIETGLTPKQVRNSIENLVESGELGKVSTSLNTLISVTNYEKYQSEGKRKAHEKTHEGQGKGTRGAHEGQQINNNNNNNNDNNENNDIPAWEDFLSYALEKKPLVNKLDLKLKYDAWVVNGWKKQSKDGKLVKILNWKSTLLNTLPYIANTPPQTVRRVVL